MPAPRPFTAEDDAVLRSMRAEGATYRTIAHRLNRGITAIMCRAAEIAPERTQAVLRLQRASLAGPR